MDNTHGLSRFILFGEDDIDDEEFLRDTFAKVDDSFTLLFVNTGQKVIPTLEKMHGDLPCLIVLDYNMPGLTAAEILKELQSYNRYNHIPKVIWSTSGSATYKTTCLDLGAADYIIKPSSMQELEKAAQHMMSFCL
jgi:CheY-like chemotaxis protein